MLFQTVPVDLTIVGARNVHVYMDPETTILLTALHWGEAAQGETRDFSMYVRNEGGIPTDVVATIIGDVSWGTVLMTPDIMSTPLLLAPDEVSEVILSITPNESAALEPHAFTMEFSDGA